MLMYKPPIEARQNILPSSNGYETLQGYHSIMTRQSLRALYLSLPQKNVILPRFVPVGVFKPITDAGKVIHYYDVPNDLSVDQDAILKMNLDPHDTVFHYVHQFGLHIPANIEFLRVMQSRGHFIVDDRSLTLPVRDYEEFGDATAYSFYKLVGVPYGGQVRMKASARARYADLDKPNRLLMNKMSQNFYFYSNAANKAIPSLMFRMYNRLFSRYVEYGHLVNQTLQDSLPAIPKSMLDKLHRVDFDKITKRRAEIAKQYYNGINPSLLLPLPLSSFQQQSLMGFPILVDDPVTVLKGLVRKGITTFRFTKIWWWDKTRTYCDLYNRNLLLPAHQGLTDANVRTIIARVNEVTADCQRYS